MSLLVVVVVLVLMDLCTILLPPPLVLRVPPNGFCGVQGGRQSSPLPVTIMVLVLLDIPPCLMLLMSQRSMGTMRVMRAMQTEDHEEHKCYEEHVGHRASMIIKSVCEANSQPRRSQELGPVGPAAA